MRRSGSSPLSTALARGWRIPASARSLDFLTPHRTKNLPSRRPDSDDKEARPGRHARVALNSSGPGTRATGRSRMTVSSGNGTISPSHGNPVRATRRDVLALSALGLAGAAARPARAAAPSGQLTYGVHI